MTYQDGTAETFTIATGTVGVDSVARQQAANAQTAASAAQVTATNANTSAAAADQRAEDAGTAAAAAQAAASGNTGLIGDLNTNLQSVRATHLQQHDIQSGSGIAVDLIDDVDNGPGVRIRNTSQGSSGPQALDGAWQYGVGGLIQLDAGEVLYAGDALPGQLDTWRFGTPSSAAIDQLTGLAVGSTIEIRQSASRHQTVTLTATPTVSGGNVVALGTTDRASNSEIPANSAIVNVTLNEPVIVPVDQTARDAAAAAQAAADAAQVAATGAQTTADGKQDSPIAESDLPQDVLLQEQVQSSDGTIVVDQLPNGGGVDLAVATAAEGRLGVIEFIRPGSDPTRVIGRLRRVQDFPASTNAQLEATPFYVGADGGYTLTVANAFNFGEGAFTGGGTQTIIVEGANAVTPNAGNAGNLLLRRGHLYRQDVHPGRNLVVSWRAYAASDAPSGQTYIGARDSLNDVPNMASHTANQLYYIRQGGVWALTNGSGGFTESPPAHWLGNKAYSADANRAVNTHRAETTPEGIGFVAAYATDQAPQLFPYVSIAPFTTPAVESRVWVRIDEDLQARVAALENAPTPSGGQWYWVGSIHGGAYVANTARDLTTQSLTGTPICKLCGDQCGGNQSDGQASGNPYLPKTM